jgi:hypothetical protein
VSEMSSNSAELRSALSRGAKIRHATQPSDANRAPDAEFTASAQLAFLEAAVNEWQTPGSASKPDENPESNLEASPAVKPDASRGKSIRSTTALKSAVALAIAVALGWLPAQRLLATTSAEAVVNARIITIRAPIEGEVSISAPETDIGSSFHTDQNILTIRNPRADSAHLSNLSRDRDQLQTNIAALDAKKKTLRSSLVELTAQQERFRLGRRRRYRIGRSTTLRSFGGSYESDVFEKNRCSQPSFLR